MLLYWDRPERLLAGFLIITVAVLRYRKGILE